MFRSTVLTASTILLLLVQGCANTTAPNPEYPLVGCNPDMDQFGNAVNCAPPPSADRKQPSYAKSDCSAQSHFSDTTCIPANDPMANAAEEILGVKQSPTGQPLDLEQSVEVGAQGVKKEFGL
ncbi:MAG: hypothetical protein U1F76_07555 [Candidatus Competibacteraceae bacterium]